jgi:hypothetical protein
LSNEHGINYNPENAERENRLKIYFSSVALSLAEPAVIGDNCSGLHILDRI